jgi:tetratricopeptide (TPR) repeat protein
MRSRLPDAFGWLLAGVISLAPLFALAQDYGGSPPEAEEAADDAKKDAVEKKKRRGLGSAPIVDQRTSRKLGETIEHIQSERWAEARKILDRFRMRALNALERAKVYQLKGIVAANGYSDYPAAREAFEAAIAEDALTPSEHAEQRFQIAQLYMAEQRWSDVVRELKRYMGMVESPNSTTYYLLAIAHYQNKAHDEALPHAIKAIELSTSPQESWLQLLLALRLTKKQYAEAVPVLEQLVRYHPKKLYWMQLSTVHGALGSYEEALIPLQLAYEQGFLTTSSEYNRLAQLLLYLDLPYRAALVMQAGFERGIVEQEAKAYELLSNSWIAARNFDEASAPLAKAAELSEGGDLFVRLAQVMIQREKWTEAASALEQALAKGSLKSPGEAKLLMGIAHYSQKQPGQAQRWFAQAQKHKDTRAEASNWLTYIERELQAQAG